MAWTKKESVQRVSFQPSYPPSPEQREIFERWEKGAENLHIDAKAGSGKSTTLVWNMALAPKSNAALMAFNNSIVADIEPRCPNHVVVKTFHSTGYGALTRKVGKLHVDNYKTSNILKKWRWLNPDQFSGPEKMKVLSRMLETADLVAKMKVTLTSENDLPAIEELVFRYGIEIDMLSEVVEILPEIFRQTVEKPAWIDFTDMMWMAIRLDLPVPEYQTLYVDEAQDMNALMIAYTKRMAGGRVMTVGDANQSIYGFAGADANSIQNLTLSFASTILPLNTSYRCGKKIIEICQTIVPDIRAYEGNGEGEVNKFDELATDIPEGSMILCRRNAPLVRPCFRLLKEGKKAIIKGKDIGSGLVRLIDQQRASSVNELIGKLEQWKAEKIEKILASPRLNMAAIEGTKDQLDCVKAIAEECKEVDEVKSKINKLFSEDRVGITLSSIHRSKGLEADHVSIIDYPRVRLNHEKMSKEDHKQEANLNYVGLSRAKKRLDLIQN